MFEIDVEAEKTKYQAEFDQFIQSLQALERQRAELIQAIAERRGIIVFLNSLNQTGNKEI